MVAPASPGQVFDAALAAVTIHFGWLYPWVVAESIFHCGASAPSTPNAPNAPDAAMRYSFFHWGLHP